MLLLLLLLLLSLGCTARSWVPQARRFGFLLGLTLARADSVVAVSSVFNAEHAFGLIGASSGYMFFRSTFEATTCSIDFRVAMRLDVPVTPALVTLKLPRFQELHPHTSPAESELL